MTATIGRAAATRQVYYHDPAAPPATVVTPSAFVAVRGVGGRILLVRRCDSGTWELPGGRVDVGETAAEAAVRETAEETSVHVLVTGLAGLFTDPGHRVRSPDGQVRQQFALLFRAQWLAGVQRGDGHETSEAAWVAAADLHQLDIEPPIRAWIAAALADEDAPYLG
jgi:ADP-ribose pyrophosphatase YjhB (NUDIX family)